MKAQLVHQTYLKCPACGESESRICHLFDTLPPRSFGPWRCDECGIWYEGIIHARDDISLEIADRPKALPVIDVLVLPPREHPVYLLVKGFAYDGLMDPEGKRYFYEEHTCPTNWTGDITKVVSEGDDDPHGLFEHVETVPADAGSVKLPDGTVVTMDD